MHANLIAPKFGEHKLIVLIHIWLWNIYTTIKTFGENNINIEVFECKLASKQTMI